MKGRRHTIMGLVPPRIIRPDQSPLPDRPPLVNLLNVTRSLFWYLRDCADALTGMASASVNVTQAPFYEPPASYAGRELWTRDHDIMMIDEGYDGSLLTDQEIPDDD